MKRTEPCERSTSMKQPHGCTCRPPCCACTHAKAVSRRRSPANAGCSSKKTLLRISVSFTLDDGKRR